MYRTRLVCAAYAQMNISPDQAGRIMYIGGQAMYGKYEVPFKVEEESIAFSLEKIGENSYHYSRTCREENLQKTVVLSKGELLIHPVEPLNTPKTMTPYLLIEFEKKLLIEPKATKKLFLSFPVEVAVLVRLNKEIKVIDSIGLTTPKFTLYGDPQNGLICKYWKSGLYETAPSPNPLQEGVLELTISNSGSDWEEVTKAVFNAYGMKIHHNDRLVAMKAKMKIGDDKTAETNFQDAALERGMKKSLETYAVRRLSMLTTDFLMEYGL